MGDECIIMLFSYGFMQRNTFILLEENKADTLACYACPDSFSPE